MLVVISLKDTGQFLHLPVFIPESREKSTKMYCNGGIGTEFAGSQIVFFQRQAQDRSFRASEEG